jgi:hypothetical protein
VQSQISIPVTLGDTARTWHISFSDGGLPYVIEDGCLAKLEIKRPTGTRIEAFCPIENNTTITYSFSQNEHTAVAEGIHECAVILYDAEGDRLASPRFTMIVSNRVVDSDDLNLSDEDHLVIESIIAAEAGRQSAEILRINTESARMEAEKNRNQNFELLRDLVNNAVEAIVSPTVMVTPINGGNKVTVNDKNGAKTFNVLNGNNGTQGPQGIQGPQGVQGLQGIQGEPGKPFSIGKIYASIAEMNSGFSSDGVAEGSFAIISGDIENDDNAKLFVKGKSAYTFVTDLSGAKGIRGPQGFQGPQGIQGPQGVEGIPGKSAYSYAQESGYEGTEESFTNDINPETIKAELSSYIATELAKRAQLKPEFMELFSELEANGDQTKLYVLPDGYIYAFLGKKIPPYVNQIPLATDNDGTVYNGVGYAENSYLSSSTSKPSTKADYECIGFIPIGIGSSESAVGEQIIYMSGIGAKTDSNFRFIIYDNDHENITNTTFTGANLLNGYMEFQIPYTTDSIGNVTSIDLTTLTAYLKRKEGKDPAFIRISCPVITEASILTVNQPITSGEGSIVYSWTNTGRQFVPADCEPQMISLEMSVHDNTNAVNALEDQMILVKTSIAEIRNGTSNVPVAVQNAASDLVDKAMSREDGRFIRFLISSDAHQKNDHALITKGTKELAQAHGEILNLIGVDFVANLGDIAWGSPTADNATVLEEAKTFNRFMLNNIRGEAQIWTEGNHETDMLTVSQIQGLIYSHNKELIQDTSHWVEGYGYIDFENQKVRVICLNTNQATGNDSSGVSDAQLKWFAEIALNMEGKTDWNVITLGHHPISYNNQTLVNNCARTIEAFMNGSNFSFTTNGGTSLAIDYSTRSCRYVGHFHGHAHAFSVVKMQKYNNGEYVELPAWEICIPNACYERNNQYLNNGTYTERYSTPTTYAKSDEDGKRTSFNLVTVCLDKRRIYADNFGAGIDREISY